MKKSTIRKYNVIAFIVLPIVIILGGEMLCVGCFFLSMAPRIDYDEVTSQTHIGELWNRLTIEEEEYSYIIYDIGFQDEFENVELIAFRGSSIEEIRDSICDCAPGFYVTSYWEGEGCSYNFTDTGDFKKYLGEVTDDEYYLYPLRREEVITKFSAVTVYDVSAYIGYEKQNRMGEFFCFAIVSCLVVIGTLCALIIELIIAVILKLTVFRRKKVKMKEKEIWDLYNENREPLGKDHIRGEQLPIDGYHLVVHVWIRNSKAEYLISQRSANRPTFPLLWECVGGSVIKGEDSRMGAIREAKEEVGVDLLPENGRVLFTKTRKVIDGKIFNDIMDVWLFEYDGEVDLGSATTDEVAQVVWMDREQIKALFEEKKLVETLEYFFTEVAPE